VFEDEEDDDIALLVEDYSQPLLEPGQTSTPEETVVRIARAVPLLTRDELRQLLKLAYRSFGLAQEPVEKARADEARRSESGNRNVGEVGRPAPSAGNVGEVGRPAPSAGEPPDLLTWGKTYLPEHFLKPPSAMHQWMAEKLDGMSADRGTKLNVLGPRGGAKSTLATLAYPLREAMHHREPYIWILSDTAEQARAHLENLKAELIDNPQIARDYPQAVGKGPTWRAGKIVLRSGVTIEAFGTGRADPRAKIPRPSAHADHLRRPAERPQASREFRVESPEPDRKPNSLALDSPLSTLDFPRCASGPRAAGRPSSGKSRTRR
jgi:hypothetical protein